jgi:hypothetical protein
MLIAKVKQGYGSTEVQSRMPDLTATFVHWPGEAARRGLQVCGWVSLLASLIDAAT